MATITWTGAAGDDNWNNPANWSPSQVPGAGDTAVITPAAATAIGVGGVTVGAVTDSATVTLTVANATNFALGAGGANSSTTFSNGGTLMMNGAGNTTNFILNDTNTTLTGGGHVMLADSGNNRLYAASGSDTLTNVNNTISGSGQFGVGQLQFVNESGGTVDATGGTAQLVMQMSGPVSNAGLIEDTGAAGLVILNTEIVQAGGTISAAGHGATVQLNGATIAGGVLVTSGGGIIETTGNGTLDGTASQVTNRGSLVVNNATNLYLAGTINNTGTISEDAAGNTTNIILGYPVVTLTGGGTIAMSNSVNNRIYGNNQGYTLNNVNDTISGAGQIGAGQMVLNNETKGVIDANQTTGLTLDTGNDVINTGLIEATGTGGLQILNTNIVNAGGTITASGAGAHVDLSGATIEGGTVSSAKGGVVDSTGNAGLDGFSHGSLTLAGTFAVNNGTTLYLSGTIDNTGAIDGNAGVNATAIRLSSHDVTLTGGGSVVLSNSDNNYIYGNASTDTLVNVNNVISGTGQLGDGQMTLINESGGTIDATNAPIANVSSGVLNLNCNGGITNAGLIEDTGTAGLSIINSTVDNLGGTIQASGAGAILTVNGSSIDGGKLQGIKGGLVNLVNSATLDGTEPGIGAVTLAGNVDVANNNTAYLLGVIDNTGTLTVNSTGNGTALRVASNAGVTLTGGGALVLSANVNNYIYGNASQFVLDNVNNTISGAGNLGDGQMTLVNESGGTIDGNSTVGLTVNCNGGMTNAGLIESTAGGGLSITNTAVDNAGGTILATGASASLYLNSSDIVGGTVKTAAGGVVFAVNNTQLDGSVPGEGALTNAGSLQVVNNNTAYLAGTIDNTGNINVDSIGNGTALRLASDTVTLMGTGSVTLSDNANNYLYGNASYFRLDNVSNTISGAGQLGDGQMALTNTGVIDATGTNALVLNTGVYDVTNGIGGLIEATGSGGLSFTSGIFSNAGTVAAAGGNVTFGSGAFNLNAVAGTLTGGAWSASGGATLAVTGGAIVTDAAALSIAGANSLIEAGNGSAFTALGASLTTIASGGSLAIGNKGTLTLTAKTLADSGTVMLAGGTLGVATLMVGGSASLMGFGTEKGSVAATGTITASGGTLDITKNLSGKGTLLIDNNATGEVGGKLTVAGVAFAAGGTETLALVNPANATSVISGFAGGDVIDLTKTAATSLSYSGNTTSGVLTVKNGSSTVATFNFSGDYKTASFKLAPQGSGVTITGTGAPSMGFLGAPPAPETAQAPPPALLRPAPTEFGAHLAPAEAAWLPALEARFGGALFAEPHIAAGPWGAEVIGFHGFW